MNRQEIRRRVLAAISRSEQQRASAGNVDLYWIAETAGLDSQTVKRELESLSREGYIDVAGSYVGGLDAGDLGVIDAPAQMYVRLNVRGRSLLEQLSANSTRVPSAGGRDDEPQDASIQIINVHTDRSIRVNTGGGDYAGRDIDKRSTYTNGMDML